MSFTNFLAVIDNVQQGVENVNPGAETDLMGVVRVIINVTLGLIGMTAVVMIIMGGFRYTSSQGDQAKVTSAKNTIIYGVVGLIVALLAFAIVNFVLVNVFQGTGGGGGGGIGA